jgi:alpha-beta hydrolase superfamily lysophospholipase
VEQGNVALYAYDQRGFGDTNAPGIWAGQATLVDDARTVAALLRVRYPNRPVYLIGESMGAAVVLLTLARDVETSVDGAVLIAPAVWGSDSMPWYQRLSLWLAMRWFPGKYFSSETVSRLGKRPTDDPEIMRSLSRDPLVLKGARIDTLYGVTELMGDASKVVSVPVPIQVLYGLNDQIIPTRPVCNWLKRIDSSGVTNVRFAIYPGGYHMLTRYSGRGRVLADIAAWLGSRNARFPSGEEVTVQEARAMVCSNG